jgi:hypothetical protein
MERTTLLLLCIMHCVLRSTEDSQKINNEYRPYINFQNQEHPASQDTKNTQSPIFTQEEIEEMELVFEASPEEAQDIIFYLKNPAYFEGIEQRAVFL